MEAAGNRDARIFRRHHRSRGPAAPAGRSSRLAGQPRRAVSDARAAWRAFDRRCSRARSPTGRRAPREVGLLKDNLPPDLAARVVRRVYVHVCHPIKHVGQLAFRQNQFSGQRAGGAESAGQRLQHACEAIGVRGTVDVRGGGRRRQAGISNIVGQFVSDERKQAEPGGGRVDRRWPLVRAVHRHRKLHGRDLAANFAIVIRRGMNVRVTSPASDRRDLDGREGRQINRAGQGPGSLPAKRTQWNDHPYRLRAAGRPMNVRRARRARQTGILNVIAQSVPVDREGPETGSARVDRRHFSRAAHQNGERNNRVGGLIGDAEKSAASVLRHDHAAGRGGHEILPIRFGQAEFPLDQKGRHATRPGDCRAKPAGGDARLQGEHRRNAAEQAVILNRSAR